MLDIIHKRQNKERRKGDQERVHLWLSPSIVLQSWVAFIAFNTASRLSRTFSKVGLRESA